MCIICIYNINIYSATKILMILYNIILTMMLDDLLKHIIKYIFALCQNSEHRLKLDKYFDGWGIK